MARKRGGIAGFYDRNKGWLKTAVPAALSFIPGVGVPLAAAAGAAMGADVEGKSYLKGLGTAQGVTGAVKGGLSGYGIGRGTQAVAGGVRSMLAPKVPDISGAMGKASGMIDQANAQILNPTIAGTPTSYVQTVGGGLPASEIEAMRQSARRGAGQMIGGQPTPSLPQFAPKVGMTPGFSASQPTTVGAPAMNTGLNLTGAANIGRVGMTPSVAAASNAISSVPESLMTASSSAPQAGTSLRAMLSGAARGTQNFLKDNSEIAKFAGKALLEQLPSAESRALEAKTELDYQKFELEKQQIEEDRRRRQRIAQLLMPYAQQQFPQYFAGTTGQ